jgi:hypothetical protein
MGRWARLLTDWLRRRLRLRRPAEDGEDAIDDDLLDAWLDDDGIDGTGL